MSLPQRRTRYYEGFSNGVLDLPAGLVLNVASNAPAQPSELSLSAQGSGQGQYKQQHEGPADILAHRSFLRFVALIA